MKKSILLILCVLFACGHAADIRLADNYVLHLAAPATPEDQLAASELQEAFLAVTKRELKFAANSSNPKIHIGVMPPGEAPLKDDEHIIKTDGSDIYLFGTGKWGNLYAVYSFIEDQLDGHYYNVNDGLSIAYDPTKTLKPFNRRYQYAFAWRKQITLRREGAAYYVRNRNNVSGSSYPQIKDDVVYLSPFSHSFYFFIPPGGATVLGSNPNNNHKGYFAEHPEYFSQDKSGNRVRTQLCLSNKSMRRELIKNIENTIVAQQEKTAGYRKKIIDFSANDSGGALCFCPDCQELEKKYDCPGGPLFDCLIEVCEFFKDKHPDITFTTLLYRKEQTQKPPQNIAKFPGNFEGVFAPIHDNFLGSITDESNRESLQHLTRWAKIANISIWYYTSQYSVYFHTVRGFPPPPLGHVERHVQDMRKFAELGIKSIFSEHDSGTACGANFVDLQEYLMYKLMQDPYLDAKKLVSQYMRDNYKAAAVPLQAWLEELEGYRKQMLARGDHFTYMPAIGQYAFYMTPANILRWQKQFDEMEKSIGNDDVTLQKIRQVRLGLDLATIADLNRLAVFYPDMAKSRDRMKERILNTVDRANKERISDAHAYDRLNIRPFLTELEREPKKLPEQFSQIPPERLIQINPDYPRKLIPARRFEDKDAAWGVAAYENISADKGTFKFGFHDYWNRTTPNSLDIDLDRVKDGYEFYNLGKVKLTQNCMFFPEKWNFCVYADPFYSIDEPDAQYEAYASLKFIGEKGGERKVLCDRIVLVRIE